LPELLARLECSLVLSTYQAGRLVSIGVHDGRPAIGFARFRHAMGVARTPRGLAVGSHAALWTLPANREIAPRIAPEGSHDIAFLSRSAHHCGPVMGHDIAWCGDRLWLVNTLFNCLCTVEAPWSFVPRWHPPFISAIAPGDRCHLNGLAVSEDGTAPAYVTVLAASDVERGWRERKRDGGCLIDVRSGATLLEGLSMPHSPRLYRGQLYLLDSGHGRLLRCDPITGSSEVVATLPGFTRGLDCFAGHAVVGLSRIRETAVFGGLPLQEQEQEQELRCGMAIVNLESGQIAASLWFSSGVEEVFAACWLPGHRNPAVIGPEPDRDDAQTVWLVPSVAS
jgi:uncharacterized protein (TIGR03032 family)